MFAEVSCTSGTHKIIPDEDPHTIAYLFGMAALLPEPKLHERAA